VRGGRSRCAAAAFAAAANARIEKRQTRRSQEAEGEGIITAELKAGTERPSINSQA